MPLFIREPEPPATSMTALSDKNENRYLVK
jgi:hypothetical protein